MLLEGLVDVLLQCGQPSDIGRIFRQKRIEQRFLFSGGVKAPFDPEPPEQLVEAEPGADHADRADQRRLLGKDFIAGERQPVTARCRHIFGERNHRDALFLRQLPDPTVEQGRLHRRAARRVDDKGDRDQPGCTKRFFDRGGMARQR